MTLSRRNFLATTALFPVVGLAIAGPSQKPSVYGDIGIAIDGTDPVSYFTAGQPFDGGAGITHARNGATWRFSIVDNRNAFAAKPEAFARQYGGYCAWAVSEGYSASTVPDAWKIVDGKLYLNYSRRIQRRWESDIPVRITAAETNWPRVVA